MYRALNYLVNSTLYVLLPRKMRGIAITSSGAVHLSIHGGFTNIKPFRDLEGFLVHIRNFIYPGLSFLGFTISDLFMGLHFCSSHELGYFYAPHKMVPGGI